MTARCRWVTAAGAILCLAATANHARPTQTAGTSSGKTERARIAFSHALPALDGGHLAATIVEVNYRPGEASAPHSHPCAVIGYVLEGRLRTRVKGEPEAIYKAGESFYEAPNGVHQISANASQKERAKFIAYFVCDHEVPLSVDAPGGEPAGGK